jgi:hypothetical protein
VISDIVRPTKIMDTRKDKLMQKQMEMVLALWVALGLAGCTVSSQTDRQFTQRGIPAKEFLVGGGFQINYTAPAEGTVYWVEETTAKILETRSVTDDENVEFKMDVEADEFKQSIGVEMAKAKMSLYFIPRRERVEGGFTEDGIPARRYQVGGGLDVEYKAPADGTLYWVEEQTRKILETRSVKQEEVAESNRTPEEVGTAVGRPPNAVSVSLYFIPSVETKR